MMTNEFLCCEKCFARIAKRSTLAAKIWLKLCEGRMALGDPFFLKVDEHLEIVTLLEQLGYITTTETLTELYFKIHGLNEDEEGLFFCIGNCEDE